MLLAKDTNGRKVYARPSERAECPFCNSEVIAKCGEIMTWHWAHTQKAQCDTFSKPETEWHLGWKSDIDPEFFEVIIEDKILEERHRADIVGQKGIVIELQHSYISLYDIGEREIFYKSMVWVLDGSRILKNLSFYDRGGYFTFKWNYPWKSFTQYADKPIFIHVGQEVEILKEVGEDWKETWGGNMRRIPKYEKETLTGNLLFEIKTKHEATPTRGSGKFVTRKAFLKRYNVKTLE